MIEVTIVCDDFDIDQLHILFDDVTELPTIPNQTSETRLFSDPTITVALIGAGSATVGLIIGQILSHVLTQRQQRLQEQLRRETTEVKIVTQSEGIQVEIVEKIPSKDDNLQNRLGAIIKQLNNLKLGEKPKVEILVVND